MTEAADRDRWRLAGAAACAGLAGLALAFALPGPGVAPLVLLVPGLLLEAVRLAPTARGAVTAGWLGGVVHWAVATHWVLPVMRDYGGLPGVVALLCLLGMAAILATTWGLTVWLARVASAPWRPLVLASAWALTEVLREGPLFRFPWNPVASVVTPWPELMGSLPVWGAVGLGWAIMAVGGGLWSLFRRESRWAGLRTAASAAVLVLLFTALAPPPVEDGPPVRVGLIQPGTTLEEKWDPGEAGKIMGRVERLTRSAATAGGELVLWPESAVPGSIERNPGLAAWVERLARETGVTIVLNSIGWTPEGRPTNSAYVVTPQGAEPRRYDKVRLVPFGEYVPWWARWGFTEGLVREVGSFVPGRRVEPLPTPYGDIGVAVCYEIVFPSLIAREVQRGAGLVVTLTNDGWYGYSWAPPQHFAQAVLRAAETRRVVLRAALTGISGVVGPDGTVRGRLPVGSRGLLMAEVRRGAARTPRVVLGEWWAWAALLLAVLGLTL